jgi:poly(3-hydroxyalkanoate) depolymerase
MSSTDEGQPSVQKSAAAAISTREPEIEIIRVGGRPLRVAVWRAAAAPAARPLLFFNGVGANIELMAPLADWLPDRDIVTFDMPGVGGSPAPRLPYRPWTMALRTARLLDRLGYNGKVDVIGVSWGGGMAQQFAFQHPRRVGKLILAATAAGLLMVPGDPKVLAKMASPRRYLDPEYMRENFAALYGEEGGSAGHVSRLSPPSRRGYLYQLAAMAGWTSAFFLPFLRQKTLILMGRDDRIVPPVNGTIMATLLPNARLELVPGGHLFLVSRPEASIRLIKAFLAEADVDPAPVTSPRAEARPPGAIAA